ncbi:MAG: ribosome maturation factor RimM [Casimicrobiaceae bacterium]
MVVMARVGAPFGVRGEVSVRPLSSVPVDMLDEKRWWIRRPAADTLWQRCRLHGARLQGRHVVTRIDDSATRDAAATLRGAEIGVDRADLPPPPAGEWYRHDLIGMAVVSREGVTLGRVQGFGDTGAHPLLQVAGDSGGGPLIPWVPRYVLAVDLDDRRIDVDWQPDY